MLKNFNFSPLDLLILAFFEALAISLGYVWF